MPVRIGVPKETTQGETRVAIVPAVAERFAALGAEVLIEKGAGRASHFPDDEFGSASVVDRAGALGADVVLKVRAPSLDEVAALREGAVLAGLLNPHRSAEAVTALRDRRVTSFALELLPRITRAQSMDALTSQASVAGYKAVLMAADLLEPLLPDAHHAGRHDPAGQGARPRRGRRRPAGDRHRPSPRRHGRGLRRAPGDARAGPVARRRASSTRASTPRPRAATRAS